MGYGFRPAYSIIQCTWWTIRDYPIMFLFYGLIGRAWYTLAGVFDKRRLTSLNPPLLARAVGQIRGSIHDHL